jgi:L-ribulokinase
MRSSTLFVKRRSRFVIGLDFGTLSARAVLVDLSDGHEIASAVHHYTDGVLTAHLPGEKRSLAHGTALQNPADYLKSLSETLPRLLRQARVRPEQIVGLGTDFTSCTVLPTKRDGTPLCFETRWRRNPHAWVKLWKHHSAQPQADRINALGQQGRAPFLRAYGGRYSSEWFFSKLLETVEHAPDVYAAADRFIEAGDWIVWQLCGRECRSSSAAGYKALWVQPGGRGTWRYPSQDFFRTLHPLLENVTLEKMGPTPLPLGSRAGQLTQAMAKRIGLLPGTPVAVGNIDAHVAVPACGVTEPGRMVMIMGTSTCHLVLAERRRSIEGVCGVVQDGIVPGFWGYEAGQAGVGDLFAWFTEQGAPHSVFASAKRASTTVFEWLENEASRLKPGQTGLLALDWWNGCRSVLMDSDLSGLLVGCTLATQPHEIYRALMEATAFGTRKIIETFVRGGIPVHDLYACGGLAQRSPLLLQIYADVTNREIKVAASEHTSALGAAMYAAVAAGAYADINAAALSMVPAHSRTFRPNPKARLPYDQLYAEYCRLHDMFGRERRGTMKLLRQLKTPREPGT